MLISQFFRGLHLPIQDRIRHLMGIVTDFDALRVAARKEEADLEWRICKDQNADMKDQRQKKAYVKMHKVIKDSDEDEDLSALVCSLQSRIQQLEQSKPQKPVVNNRWNDKKKTYGQQHSSQGKGFPARPKQTMKKKSYKKSSYTVPTCYRCGI